MKLLILLFLLISCEGKDSPEAPCDNSKQLFSKWTSGDGSLTLDLTGFDYGDVIMIADPEPQQIFMGDPIYCYNPRGDFKVQFGQDNLVSILSCGNVLRDTASLSQTCNVMTVTYYSDGSKETFH